MMPQTIKLRRGMAATWESKNPILLAGEPGLELDTGRLKVGNGVQSWNNLPYIAGTAGEPSIELVAHIDSVTPHSIYDDGPSLLLLYENAKV